MQTAAYLLQSVASGLASAMSGNSSEFNMYSMLVCVAS